MAVVTISRLFGSGGSEVARLVAERLGWTLLDNAFVERLAARLHATPSAVEAAEERSPSLASRLAAALANSAQEPLSASLQVSLPLSEERMLQVTKDVIDDEVSRGPVVVVGRGAQLCLGAARDALHVLCVAPLEELVARVQRREGCAVEEATRRVREENKRRAHYVRRLWDRDWLDASAYHLCVDTSRLGITGTAQLVVQCVRGHMLP